MPDLTITIEDGQLGLVNVTGQDIVVHAGVCAAGVPGTIYSFGDIPTATSTLGPGTCTEDVADTISVAGECIACPITPSQAGSVGSTTKTGTGAGTVTGTAGPAFQILAKVTTGGALATAAFAFSVNGAPYGVPVVSAASWTYLVPGTFTVLSFATQTYTANDVWTITTAGVITVVGSGTSTWITQASSPTDIFDVLVTIVLGGAIGTAQFTYSLDGGNSVSPTTLVPGGGVFVLPGAGVILTFASTFVAGDLYEFTTVTAGYTTTDTGNMLTALLAGPQQWFGVHIGGQGANAAAAATMAATVDSALEAAAVQYRYVMGMVECPQGDSAASTAFASVVATRTMITLTDILHQSSVTRGRVNRRNCGVVIASRLAAVNPSQDPGWVGSPLGSLANVQAIFRDESKTPGLASLRFTVLTTRPTKAGYFCQTGNMMAQFGSDYSSVGNRRVMDIACFTTVGVLVNELNADALSNPDGSIYDPEATRLEGVVIGALGNVLLSPTPPDATSVNAVVNRNNNIIATEMLQITTQIIPKGKIKTISETIGFQV